MEKVKPYLWVILAIIFITILSWGLFVLSVDNSRIGSPDIPGFFGDSPLSSGSNYQMPVFEWPPPTASAMYVLQYFHQEQNSFFINTVGDIDRTLAQVLNETGYFERSYYAVPDGFALVTRLERILDDGTIVTNNRWSIDDGGIQNFSFSQYLRRLFYADPGLFRVVVFIISPHPFNQTDRQVSQDEALRWLNEGFNVLPQVVANKPFTVEYNVTALVYQFEKRENEDPTVVVPSNIPGQRHLQAAGILNLLN